MLAAPIDASCSHWLLVAKLLDFLLPTGGVLDAAKHSFSVDASLYTMVPNSDTCSCLRTLRTLPPSHGSRVTPRNQFRRRSVHLMFVCEGGHAGRPTSRYHVSIIAEVP